MNRIAVIDLIFSLSGDQTGFESLESRLSSIGKPELLTMVLECGVMPEVFHHDSSEEKLWAKYSDILLAKSLEFLGFKSQVLRVRGDSADVFAESRKYKIVGDAKTFRLSRTAKNQKDFKVEALDSWRRSSDYATLVGPFCQFPNTSSAIYRQAITKNVTLLSYSHLYFMVKHYSPKINIEPLWKVGDTIHNHREFGDMKSAGTYWRWIDRTLLDIFKKAEDDFDRIRQLDIETTRRLGHEGIEYWEKKIDEYRHLSKEEAIRRLLKAEKIETKLEQIKKVIAREVVQ
jgi:type II restriction enzyme